MSCIIAVFGLMSPRFISLSRQVRPLKTETKRWTQLGLSAALAGTTLLAACGNSSETATPVAEAPAASVAEAPAADAVETHDAPAVDAGGEGEGGVAVEQAATDPVVFRSALAITEAHIIAARDAYAVGETSAAGEMFAHPVSEVLFDVGPYLQERGVENFDDLLLNASAAVFEGETVEQISERTDEIIATLRAAAEKAPDNGMSQARIQAGVAADQIDRAAVMYGMAMESDFFEPYLDGYGFYEAAKAAFEQEEAAIRSELPGAATSIEAALDLLSSAYATVERPETLDANPAALTASSSAILLALGN